MEIPDGGVVWLGREGRKALDQDILAHGKRKDASHTAK
jgi:hypothetical protein